MTVTELASSWPQVMTSSSFQVGITEYRELFLDIIILWLRLNNRTDNVIFGHLLSGRSFIGVQYGTTFLKFAWLNEIGSTGYYLFDNEPCCYVNVFTQPTATGTPQMKA